MNHKDVLVTSLNFAHLAAIKVARYPRGDNSIASPSSSAAYMGGFFGGPTLHERGIIFSQAYMKGVHFDARLT